MNFYYRCSTCGREYDMLPGRTLCDTCIENNTDDMPPGGVLEVMWKTAPPWTDDFDLLPVEREYFLNLPVGNTPLWQSGRLSAAYGHAEIYLKYEGTNLTGSLKDRASFLVAAFARRSDIRKIIVASTGNAGSSMAGVGAAYGLAVMLYVPEKAPQAKLVQAMQYGAEIHLVKGNYDLAFRQAMAAAANNNDAINRNTAVNPLTIEGKKTVSLEIVRQLHGAPDVVFVPVGDGVILGGVYKGFEDLLRLEKIEHIPQVIAVQAEGSSAICRGFKEEKFTPTHAHTIADSIAVDVPANGRLAAAKLKKYNGACITVSDRDILAAQLELSAITGVFAEPAAAASFAGYKKMAAGIEKDKKIVLLITGTGLKDISAASQLTGTDFN